MTVDLARAVREALVPVTHYQEEGGGLTLCGLPWEPVRTSFKDACPACCDRWRQLYPRGKRLDAAGLGSVWRGVP